MLAAAISIGLGALYASACAWSQAAPAIGDHGPSNGNTSSASTENDADDSSKAGK